LDGAEWRLKRWELQRAARELLPNARVRVCLRHRLSDDRKGVGVRRRERDGATYYEGLMVCGSSWVCPVCAAKISERRRVELLAAISSHRERGGEVVLLTLTVPHSQRSDPLELVDRTTKLVTSLWGGRDRIKSLLPGYVGHIRALEVTHGEHGWHPHVHILLFIASGCDLQALHEALWTRWERRVKRSGLGTPSPSAFSLQDGSHASRYVGKWGLAEEVTKANVKQARSAAGRSPFALLADYVAGDRQAGALFREFAAAFKGRHQLSWSRGLRDALGLSAEKSDEELAATVDAQDRLLCRISDDDWKVVKRYELRALVLEVLRSGEWADLDRLLSQYRPLYSDLRASPG
jgi:hypothetical protein